MPATARVDSSPPDASVVQVRVPQQPALAIVDARAAQFTPEQVEQAEKRLAERAGPLVARVWERTEATWVEVRAELNQVAGGQASARVMAIAHNALRAAQALELQTLAAARAFGEETEQNEKHMRNQAGLAIVATDALNKAYEIAREEGKAAQGQGPVGQLMGKLGIPAPASAPVQTPPGGSLGAPLSPNPTPSKKDPR